MKKQERQENCVQKETDVHSCTLATGCLAASLMCNQRFEGKNVLQDVRLCVGVRVFLVR